MSTRCRFSTCVVGGMLVVGAMGLGMARPVTGLAAQPSRYVVGGSATDVVHAGELAYVVVADRLVPADVSNPLAPTSVGEPTWLGSSNDLAMGNGVIYAAQGLAPLGVIDLADPLRPMKIQSVFTSSSFALRVSVEGDRAWVLSMWLPSAMQTAAGAACDGQEILDVYDLTDPRAPRQIGSLAGGGRVSGRDLATAGDYAYVAAGEPRIDIYELRRDGVVPAIDSGPLLLAQIANVIAADGQVLCVAAEGGVDLFDLADPIRPRKRAHLPASGQIRSIAITGDRVAVGTAGTWLHMFDISALDAPRLIGSLTLPADAIAVDLAGDVAYVAADGAGFEVVDFAPPGGGTTTTALPGLGSAVNVAVDGSVLFAALAGDNRFALVDRSTAPAFPILSELKRSGTLQGLTAAGGRVYAFERDATGVGSLTVIDASDPRSPTRAGSLVTRSGAPTAVGAADGACLVSSWARSALVTFDVRDDAHPVEAASVTGAGWNLANVAVDDTYAFVLDLAHGIHVFDVSDCAHPREVAGLSHPGLGPQLALEPVGRRLYVGGGDPSSALAVLSREGQKSSSLPGRAAARTAHGASLSPGSRVLQQPTQPPPLPHERVLVIDVSDPLNPLESSWWEVPGELQDLVADGGWVHAAYRHVEGHGWGVSLWSRYLTGDELVTASLPQDFRLVAAPDAVYWAGGAQGVWEKSLVDQLPGATPPTPTATATPVTIPTPCYLPLAMNNLSRNEWRPPRATNTPPTPSASTPSPVATATPTSTVAATPPRSATPSPSATPTAMPSASPTLDGSLFKVFGYVREGSESGPGLPGVAVTLWVQSYDMGTFVTDADGYYESGVHRFHRESFHVVPRKSGYHFVPEYVGGTHYGFGEQEFHLAEFVALQGEPTNTPAEDREADFVNAISIDPASGDKWFGTRRGVSRLMQDETLERYTTADGLAGDWVNATAIDAATGDKWFGNATGVGVSRLGADGTWRTFTTADGLAWGRVTALAIDAISGDVWFGVYGGGVSRLGADGTWRTFTTVDGLASVYVSALAIDAATGDRWFGTDRGVSRLGADGTWQTYTTANGLTGNRGNAIAIDAATGDRWFGTESGVSRLGADGTWRTFTTADGLASEVVTALAVDGISRDTWFGTNGRGVSRLGADGQWRTYSLRPR